MNEDTNKKYIKKVRKETSTDREVYKAVEESKLILEEQYEIKLNKLQNQWIDFIAIMQ